MLEGAPYQPYFLETGRVLDNSNRLNLGRMICVDSED